jgi:hypothetical protein
METHASVKEAQLDFMEAYPEGKKAFPRESLRSTTKTSKLNPGYRGQEATVHIVVDAHPGVTEFRFM